MQSEKGSATVPVALFGVSPNSWYGTFHSPFGAPGRVGPARRRDADESGRDDRAPQPQLHHWLSGHEHKSSDICCALFGLGRGSRREPLSRPPRFLTAWLDTPPALPEDEWFKPFPGMTVCEGRERLKIFPVPEQDADYAEPPDKPGEGSDITKFRLTVTLLNDSVTALKSMCSVEELASQVNDWCERQGVAPASGQVGDRITERNIRYYRALGLVDPPLVGGGQGYGEKHRLQLVALRLLQAQGLPLNRIRDLLFGRNLEELQRLETQGLAEIKAAPVPMFRPPINESWGVTQLDEEFLLVSRRGRGLTADLRRRLLAVLHRNNADNRRRNGATRRN